MGIYDWICAGVGANRLKNVIETLRKWLNSNDIASAFCIDCRLLVDSMLAISMSRYGMCCSHSFDILPVTLHIVILFVFVTASMALQTLSFVDFNWGDISDMDWMIFLIFCARHFLLSIPTPYAESDEWWKSKERNEWKVYGDEMEIYEWFEVHALSVSFSFSFFKKENEKETESAWPSNHIENKSHMKWTQIHEEQNTMNEHTNKEHNIPKL